MNEYWKADDSDDFCFCQDGRWYRLSPTESSTWQVYSVVMDRGLPTEMHQSYYHEIDQDQMLTRTGWSREQLTVGIRSSVPVNLPS